MEYIRGIVNRVRIKLNKNIFRSCMASSILSGAICSLIVQLISMVVPMYYIWIYMLIPIAVSIIIGMILGIRGRVDDRTAALYIDSFGLQERVTTALDNEKYADRVCVLQREDAEKSLRIIESDIKVPFNIPWIRYASLVMVCLLAVICYFVPTKAKLEAESKHEAKVAAREAEKEVEELLEALSQIDEKGLTEEEINRIKEMQDSLEGSRQDFKAVQSENEYNKARGKYDYKLDEISDTLSQLSEGKGDNVYKQMKTAEEMANSQKSEESKKASNDKPSDQNGQSSEQEQGSGQKTDQQGQQGNEGSSQQGQTQKGDDGNGQQGQGQQGDGQQGSDGQGDGQQGSDGKGGEGDAEEGEGNQNGKAGQSGPGQGQGEGNIEKSIDHNHEYVTVDQNVTGKYTENESSEYAHEKNGIHWEGEAVPYDTVIGDYKDRAYEGIERGRYPGGMSDVIKDYFTGLSD